MNNQKYSYIFYIIAALILAAVAGVLLAKSPLIILLMIIIIVVATVLILNKTILYYLTLFSILGGQLVRISLSSDQNGALLLIDLLLVVEIIAWIIYKIKHNQKLAKTPLNKWILIFAGLSAASLLLASRFLDLNEIIVSSSYLFRWIIYMLFFFMTLDELDSAKKWITVLKVFLVVGIGIAILGILQYIFFPNFTQMALKAGWDPHLYRVLSVFFDPNYTGGFLAIIITMMLALYAKIDQQKLKIYLIIGALPVIAAFILTYSRSSYLALAAMLLVVFIFQARKLALIFMMLLLIGGTIIITNDKIYQKIVQRIEGIQNVDITAMARIDSWSNAWLIISDHPVTGIGFNAYPYIQEKYGFVSNLKGHAVAGSDSSILNVWAMTGVFGLIAFLIIYYLVLRQSYFLIFSKNSWLGGVGLGFFATLFGLLVHSLFVNSLFYPFFMIVFWLLAGLVFAGPKLFLKNEK